jgi:hypothetical protein
MRESNMSKTNEDYVMIKSIKFIICCIIFFMHTLFAARAPGYQYLSPSPNARCVSPQATIIVRFEDATPADLKNLKDLFRVTDANGGIAGKSRIASDGKTIIFQPAKPFSLGSFVHVSISPVFKNSPVRNIDYTFQIVNSQIANYIFPEEETEATDSSQPLPLNKAAAGPARIMPNGVSVPGDFPHINVTVNKATADGYIFLNNWSDDHPFNIIFANDGSPVWYRRAVYGDRRRDFKVQKNGTITMLVRSSAGYPFGQGHVAYDQNFNEIKTFHAVDGYETDEHELQVLENGHYLLIGLRGVSVDMSKIVPGGQKNANLGVGAIQEFTPEGDLIFLWDAYIEIPDYLPYTELEDLTSGGFRYPHMNAIDIDDDGNILLSCRHLSTVFKLDRSTGEIIWELGGHNSDFTFVNDPLDGFRNQHDVRNLGNNHLTVFDNGNLHNPSRSRGAEYVLDLAKKTASLVWEYRNPPGTNYSYYMGNTQRLPNGNTLIDWAIGDRPKATEVTPGGQVVYEMNFVDGYHCYRAFRFPWHGNVAKPTLMVEQTLNDVLLIFNKFGDPDVAYYNIYGGLAPNATALLDTSKKTLKKIGNLQNNKMYYIRVAAVHSNGSESDFSNEEHVIIQKVEPGVNLVLNSDFSKGKDSWTFELQGGDADWNIEDGVSHFVIRNGASTVYAVQLRQNQMPLIQGERYLFEFDAWAASPRTIEAKVGQEGGSYTNYSRIGLTALTKFKKHFTYEFTMQEPSDPNGRVVINAGNANEDVFLDNVTLRLLSETKVEKTAAETPSGFSLRSNYPNPFNSQTSIPFHVPATSRIVIDLYDVLGRFQTSIVNAEFQAGEHKVTLDASILGSGMYFYRMTAFELSGKPEYRAYAKLMVIK